jgi:NarL family two-component system response regulator LiaR
MLQINVMLVEDHKLVREGTRQLLEQAPDIKVIGEASSGEEAIRLISQIAVDIVLMDVHLPNLSGIETTRIIKETKRSLRVLILSAYDDDRYVFPLLDAGASGYLLKTSSGDELIEAIRTVHSGEVVFSPSITSKVYNRFTRRQNKAVSIHKNDLTDRELVVLQEVARGKTNKDIGRILMISPLTVQAHLKNIFSKLGMSSRAEAAAYAVNQGWITFEQRHGQ